EAIEISQLVIAGVDRSVDYCGRCRAFDIEDGSVFELLHVYLPVRLTDELRGPHRHAKEFLNALPARGLERFARQPFVQNHPADRHGSIDWRIEGEESRAAAREFVAPALLHGRFDS